MENEMAEEQAQATLREALTESIATHSEPEPDPSPAPDAGAESAPAAEPTEARPGRTAGRARDASGKLLPGKPVRDSAAQPQTPDAGASTVAAQPAPAAAEPALPPIQRPSSWPKEMWPIWDKLAAGTPLTAQEQRQAAEFNVKREGQFATGVSTYKQIADSAKPLMDAIAPFEADLKQHGIPAADMVHRLMSAHKSLSLGSPQQKLQQFSQLAQSYGIPIQALYDQNAQQQYLASAPAQAQQPQAQQPVQDINRLVEQAIADREVKQTVASMASNTEKYPFFQYVRADMSQLLETGAATDLDDAYQKTLELPQHSLLTSALQQQQATAAEAQRIAKAAATASAARASAVSPRSATPASAAAPAAGNKGVRDSLKDAIGIHAGGARV